MRERIQAGLATLRLRVHPPNTQVVCDERAVEGEGTTRALVIDPGRHRLQLSAPGHSPAQLDVFLTAGGVEERSVRLLPEASEPAPDDLPAAAAPSPAPKLPASQREKRLRRPWLWAGLGVAAAVLATGAVVLATRDAPEPNPGTWPADP